MRRARAKGIAVALLAALASPAHAHLVQTGFGDFYDGIAHVAATPADLLVVLALALLAGQRGTGAARYAVLALPAAWFAGGIVGAHWPSVAAMPLLTTLSFATTGALVALNARVRDAGVAALAIAAGILHGFANGATMTPADVGYLAMGGAVSAIFFLTVVVSAHVTALPAGWPQIVVRVAGSWITATGMLMFGWLAHSAAWRRTRRRVPGRRRRRGFVRHAMMGVGGSDEGGTSRHYFCQFDTPSRVPTTENMGSEVGSRSAYLSSDGRGRPRNDQVRSSVNSPRFRKYSRTKPIRS